MARAAIENELLKLEKQFWQALQDNDVEAASGLTDFPCIITGPQGLGRVDKKAFESMMKTSSYTIDEFELDDDVQIRMLNDDVAVVAYKVHEKLTVEGKPVTIDAADSSTWVRRDGQWLCALHTEAIMGDPFGRDRAADTKAAIKQGSQPDDGRRTRHS